MANPAQHLESARNFLVRKDTFIFDGNSHSAHVIARTILVHDLAHHFDLVPRQNAPFFGIALPLEHSDEKFILVTQQGEVLSGQEALERISQRLKLASFSTHQASNQSNYH